MSPELLENKNYYQNLLSVMGSSEWLLFMSTFVRRINLVTKIYWTYLFIGLIGAIYILIEYDLASLESRFWIIGITGGLVLSLIVTPVLHELIHALAFKLFGAKSINFRWSWPMFRFNIAAKGFVLSKQRYYLICSFTFLLFSVLPFIFAFYAEGALLFLLLSISFFHALYAMKDLAVCSYLYKFSNCLMYQSEKNETIFYKSVL